MKKLGASILVGGFCALILTVILLGMTWVINLLFDGHYVYALMVFLGGATIFFSMAAYSGDLDDEEKQSA